MDDEKSLEELYNDLDSLYKFEDLMLKHLTGQVKIIGYNQESAIKTIFDMCREIYIIKNQIDEILKE